MTLPRTYRFFRPSRPLRSFFVAALFVGLPGLFLLGSSCSPTPIQGGGGAGDCLSNPFICKPTETCWPNDAVTKFVCIGTPSGKKPGDPCDFIGGQVVCGPGDVCIVQGTNKGVCTPYCDANHMCPSLAGCEDYMIGGPSGQNFDVHACDAVTIGKTGATSSSATGSSASTGTSGG